MSWRRIENLRQILLIIVLGAFSCFLSINAIGRSERNRQVAQAQKLAEGQTKPAPKPMPTLATAQPAKKDLNASAQDQGGTIKINSNLVAVPVSVTDASGQPVRNLTAEDFRVEEEGKSQQVVALGEPGKTTG